MLQCLVAVCDPSAASLKSLSRLTCVQNRAFTPAFFAGASSNRRTRLSSTGPFDIKSGTDVSFCPLSLSLCAAHGGSFRLPFLPLSLCTELEGFVRGGDGAWCSSQRRSRAENPLKSSLPLKSGILTENRFKKPKRVLCQTAKGVRGVFTMHLASQILPLRCLCFN